MLTSGHSYIGSSTCFTRRYLSAVLGDALVADRQGEQRLPVCANRPADLGAARRAAESVRSGTRGCLRTSRGDYAHCLSFHASVRRSGLAVAWRQADAFIWRKAAGSYMYPWFQYGRSCQRVAKNCGVRACARRILTSQLTDVLGEALVMQRRGLHELYARLVLKTGCVCSGANDLAFKPTRTIPCSCPSATDTFSRRLCPGSSAPGS